MKRRAAETQQREAQGREIGVQARESKNLSAKHSRIIGIAPGRSGGNGPPLFSPQRRHGQVL